MEEWINHVAVDDNGAIYGYEVEPIVAQFFLAGCPDDIMECWSAIEDTGYTYLGVTKPPKNWKSELYSLNDTR